MIAVLSARNWDKVVVACSEWLAAALGIRSPQMAPPLANWLLLANTDKADLGVQTFDYSPLLLYTRTTNMIAPQYFTAI